MTGRNLFVSCLFVVLLTFSGLGTGMNLQAQDRAPAQRHLFGAVPLTGVWELTLTLPPNPLFPPEIRLFGNFTLDGSFISTSNLPEFILDPALPPVRLGTGHGSWRRIGWRTYEFETFRFVTLPDGTAVGIAKGTGVVESAGRDHLIGTIQLQELDLDMNPVLPPLPGTVTARRLGPKHGTQAP